MGTKERFREDGKMAPYGIVDVSGSKERFGVCEEDGA